MLLPLCCLSDTVAYYDNNNNNNTQLQVSRYQKGKTNLDLLKQQAVSGSGISWAICKSAPHLRQVKPIMPVPHHSVYSARCNIYISRLCYHVSVRLSVRLSVMEVHWRITANLGFKFRSYFTAHCGRRAAGGRRAARRAACGRIISCHASQC